MENKLGVLRNILSEFIKIDETINNIFNLLFDLLGLINLEANFNYAKKWFIEKIEDHIE